METKQKEAETGNETSELRLAQLQHQLPSNEPGALMHLVEEVTGEDEEDQDTKDCKKLFKNMKFFVSREARPYDGYIITILKVLSVNSWEFVLIVFPKSYFIVF